MQNGGPHSGPPVDPMTFPIELTDHKPVDVVYDLDTFSTPGGPAQQPQCAIAVDARKRSHAGWIGKPPRLARVTKAPKRKVLIEIEHFVAPPDAD
jgi:hypothetical protein